MLSQPFTPAIQAVWDIFQGIICDILEVQPEQVVYGNATQLGNGGLRASFLDSNACFLIICDQFKGIDISVFDGRFEPDIDDSFEALCYLLHLSDEPPAYLKDKSPILLRYKEPWTLSMITTA